MIDKIQNIQTYYKYQSIKKFKNNSNKEKLFWHLYLKYIKMVKYWRGYCDYFSFTIHFSVNISASFTCVCCRTICQTIFLTAKVHSQAWLQNGGTWRGWPLGAHESTLMSRCIAWDSANQITSTTHATGARRDCLAR